MTVTEILKSSIKLCMFDQYGTVVDMQGGLRDVAAPFLKAKAWLGDPNALGGANRAYLTKSWRATGGVHINFTDRIILKAEYLYNGEYDGIPHINNNVITSSLVLIE